HRQGPRARGDRRVALAGLRPLRPRAQVGREPRPLLRHRPGGLVLSDPLLLPLVDLAPPYGSAVILCVELPPPEIDWPLRLVADAAPPRPSAAFLGDDGTFAALEVDYLVRGGTRVSWSLSDGFAVPPPHAFQLQVGRAGVA